MLNKLFKYIGTIGLRYVRFVPSVGLKVLIIFVEFLGIISLFSWFWSFVIVKFVRLRLLRISLCFIGLTEFATLWSFADIEILSFLKKLWILDFFFQNRLFFLKVVSSSDLTLRWFRSSITFFIISVFWALPVT